ncbi:hypothetical protein Y032_0012g1847 [Ancylostoma ceylanicum]|uniref:Uncharacterized protein n=1 Tax=Ancylostoma ceylanicum TaxID=53326 RepID=A0A016VDL9_9BILA|nr:hypothetical protein Y032_0012g1847 [Ancylostoma ceylanicum]
MEILVIKKSSRGLFNNRDLHLLHFYAFARAKRMLIQLRIIAVNLMLQRAKERRRRGICFCLKASHGSFHQNRTMNQLCKRILSHLE